MAEPARLDLPAAPAGAGGDPAAALAALRAEAADRLDPVGFHYLETLARRLPDCPEAVRRLLAGRLAAALAAYRERLERARAEAGATIAGIAADDPELADALRRLLVAGDFRGIRRRVADRQRGGPPAPLAELARHVAAQAPVGPDGGGRGELKAIRYFRDTWSQLSADRQLAEAIGQAPEQAGPLNSQMLVLRSLALMRQLSPDYLKRFMAYADALLWLDQAEQGSRPPARKPRPAKTRK